MSAGGSGHVFALVVAAGRGVRAGSGLPKQYRALGGVALLRRTLMALLQHRALAGRVLTVIHPDDADLYARAAEGLALLPPVPGGATRQDSVMAGLAALAPREAGCVLIHDGARPFVTPDLIDRLIAALDRSDGAIAAVPVTDTLKREDQGRIGATVPREGLWRAQTPQAFRFGSLLRAHEAARGRAFTDDAAVAEAAGLEVALVPASEDNIKVTTPDDFTRAERLLLAQLPDIRTGQGFDVHAFGPGDHVMLCGVRVPHDQGLVGHSDADAGLHALTDAVLGTIGAGDIGSHFPPSDPQWRGVASARFLAHAARLVADRGGLIAHADITLICERPRIGPHRAAMQARVAEILGIDPMRVSIKATTTEGLGFTGRREGLGALATATVRLPA